MDYLDSNIDVSQKSEYKKGLMDGIPICLGYVPLAMALGVTASKMGLSIWYVELMNMAIYSGSGGFAILNLIAGGEASIVMFALTLFVVNCRYLLLSMSMAQKLDPKMGFFSRFLFGIFNTDEIFGLATQRTGYLKAPYLFGLVTLPFIGWMAGSFVGSIFTSILPKSVSDALGIMLYAMLVAVVVPAAKMSKEVLFVVLNSILISVLLECNPVVKSFLTSGWIMVICAIVSSVFSSVFFPVNETDNSSEQLGGDDV